MQKMLFLSAFFSLSLLLWGCNLDVSTPMNVDVNSMVSSGAEALSGAWNSTKEVSQQYYNDQIKPSVDTAIDVAQEEREKLAQEAKNQYNQSVEQINEAIQGQADQAKDQVNKLKVE